MAQQYIFQMQGLTKTFPGGKKIFENIWLSFYNDAKIGVVGVNGSGKSTLLKIMAGLDTEFSGEARAADGDAALPRIQTVKPRGVRRGQRDEALQGDAALGHAFGKQDRQAGFHAGDAVRHPAERGRSGRRKSR